MTGAVLVAISPPHRAGWMLSGRITTDLRPRRLRRALPIRALIYVGRVGVVGEVVYARELAVNLDPPPLFARSGAGADYRAVIRDMANRAGLSTPDAKDFMDRFPHAAAYELRFPRPYPEPIPADRVRCAAPGGFSGLRYLTAEITACLTSKERGGASTGVCAQAEPGHKDWGVNHG